MKWRGRQKSSNVEDRRGSRSRGGAKKFGIGSIIIIVIALALGENPIQFLQIADQVGMDQGSQSTTNVEATDELGAFVSVVLRDTEDVWNQILGSSYDEPALVLFSGSIESRCGYASAASGPFYCPGDQKLYIDLSFYNELKNRFNAPGDFAMAYVIAHEVGHHIQYLNGTTRQLDAQRGRISKEDYNALSVKLELQADFLAGVWAHHADRLKDVLEEGDIQEALNAAQAIGDDRLQKQSQGYVVPESFTHGTSAQRMKWFKLGYDTGDLSLGNTFNATRL